MDTSQKVTTVLQVRDRWYLIRMEVMKIREKKEDSRDIQEKISVITKPGRVVLVEF